MNKVIFHERMNRRTVTHMLYKPALRTIATFADRAFSIFAVSD